MKLFYNRGIRPNLYFWRDQTGREVDLLVDGGTRLYPFEIKSAQTINNSFFDNLEYFRGLSGTPAEQAYPVYNGEHDFNMSKAKVRRWDQLPAFD